MTITDIAGLLTSIATLLTAGTGLYVSLGNRAKIKAVEHATNGMKAELVAATRISGQSEGRDEERRHPTA
jgi:hypothetical protein